MCTRKTGGAIKPCLFVIEFGAKCSLARLFDVATVGIEHRNRQIYGKENGTINSPELVANAIAEPVSEAEFAKALSAVVDRWKNLDVMDLWLDIDTYKTPEPKLRLDALSGVTLGDVQAFAKKLQGEPAAVVVVIPPAK